jgi:NAD(P)-dependent dehydrogenase (short-subunit alcohol dehydrogenase family)
MSGAAINFHEASAKTSGRRTTMTQLRRKVCLVTGATRGAGRGIACALGEAGATVYCTGRSVRGRPASDKRPETIEETAEMVSARGGIGRAVAVDHTDPEQVRALLDRIRAEQGHLDVLVNNIWWGCDPVEWGKPFWQLPLGQGLLMQQRAVHSHVITSYYAVPLMLKRRRGLIVEVTDGDNFGYRGDLFVDLAKTAVIRLAYAQASELRKHGLSAAAITPGYMRSEAILDHWGVTEANWQEGAKKDPHFINSETPFFVGRAVAALAADPQVAKKSGRVFSSWKLAKEYGFTDVDGRQPDWDEYMRGIHFPNYDRLKKCDDAFYEYCIGIFE